MFDAILDPEGLVGTAESCCARLVTASNARDVEFRYCLMTRFGLGTTIEAMRQNAEKGYKA